jgi:hypothetical protein
VSRHDASHPAYDPPPCELSDMALVWRLHAVLRWGFESRVLWLELSKRCGCRCDLAMTEEVKKAA